MALKLMLSTQDKVKLSLPYSDLEDVEVEVMFIGEHRVQLAIAAPMAVAIERISKDGQTNNRGSKSNSR